MLSVGLLRKILSDFQVGFVLVKFIANFTQRNLTQTRWQTFDSKALNKKNNMKKQNKLELIGIIILTIGGILFLIDKFLTIEFLNSVIEFREIILYSGLGIWALGLMQKESLKRKKSTGKENE